MTELVAMATRAQERIERLTADLVTAQALNSTLQANNEKLLERNAILTTDLRSYGYVAGDVDETKTVAALRSAVIAIMAPEIDKENWLEGAGWLRTRDGGWRESHLSGTMPFATACDIQIRKDLGPFEWLRNNPSVAGQPGEAR